MADIDKFRTWKENGGQVGEDHFNDLFKKNNAEFVKDADVEKYRHWAEQNYCSPYTGKAIPLSELFTEKYQVDHIIPRAKFYDDSFSNKVVVEAEVNSLKDNRLSHSVYRRHPRQRDKFKQWKKSKDTFGRRL